MKNSTKLEIKIYQIDAFTDKPFNGNPAAVCPLDQWYDDVLLQKIANENNLSETAFFVPENDGFRLRWFTPTVEVDLCGHATLAAAWVLLNHLNYASSRIRFQTRSGELIVSQENEVLCMDFPAKKTLEIEAPAGLLNALGLKPQDVIHTCQSDDLLIEVKHEDCIKNLSPNFNELLKIPTRGIIVTSQSSKFDFISRWFGPKVGVNEDPVTGSAHTTLVPYWSNKINKDYFSAEQGGLRKGQLQARMSQDKQRVYLYGKACLVMLGTLFIPQATR